MTAKFKSDIKTVVDYLWEDEKRHYSCGRSKNHIFLVLKRLAKAVESKDKKQGLQQ